MKNTIVFISAVITVLLMWLPGPAAIIADHTAVDEFDAIPQEYIDSVKTKLLYIAGESHSTAYGYGLQLLAAQDSRYPGVGGMLEDVQYAGTENPSYPAFDPQNPQLRMIRGYAGEGWWFSKTVPDWAPASIPGVLESIQRYNSQGVSAMGFGWCWDMTWRPYADNVSSGIDPVYRCRWFGRSQYGPQGDRCWGLDAEDSAVSGNSVCMDTYLQSTQIYVDTCLARGYTIRPFFTTGPIDAGTDDTPGEQGYVRQLKHERIRAWVNSHADDVLFDFADILSYNNAGQQATGTWTDDQGVTHTFPAFHEDNGVSPYSAYHFGETGAIRVGKAIWWMFARIAGWEPTSNSEKQKSADRFFIENPNPNPCNPGTAIRYGLAKRGTYSIAVYDMRGNLVRTLKQGNASSGSFSVQWNGTDAHGAPVASGNYIVHMKSGNMAKSRIIVLMK